MASEDSFVGKKGWKILQLEGREGQSNSFVSKGEWTDHRRPLRGKKFEQTILDEELHCVQFMEDISRREV